MVRWHLVDLADPNLSCLHQEYLVKVIYQELALHPNELFSVHYFDILPNFDAAQLTVLPRVLPHQFVFSKPIRQVLLEIIGDVPSEILF